MTRMALVVPMLAACAALSGCVDFSARARVPGSFSFGEPPAPPSQVSQADPNSLPDLRRENQQLHDRLAWVEDHNRRQAKKYSDLGKDMDEIRADMQKLAAERDRYRRAAGY